MSEGRKEATLAGLPMEALKAARMVAWEYDPANRTVRLSENAAEVLGLEAGKRSEAAEQAFQRIHPEDAEDHGRKVRAALEQLGGYLNRYRVVRPSDGQVIWLEERGHVIQNNGAVRLVGVSTDITARKQAEDRNRFLVQLDDALRPLTQAEAVMRAASEMLGLHMAVDRCAYADVESDEDTMNLLGNYRRDESVKSIVGRLRFSDFGAEVLKLMRDNKPFVVEDIEKHEPPIGNLEAYLATQIHAVICMPLHKAGRFVAAMAVHSMTPRKWRADEVELVQIVADRCWESIERIRVERDLHKSDERYRSLFNTIDTGFCTIEMRFDESGRAVDYVFVEVNPAFERQSGIADAVGKSMRALAPQHEQYWFDIYGEVARTGKPIRFENPATALNDRWFDVYAIRVDDPALNRVAVLFRDVTKRRRAEKAVVEREAVLRTVTNEARVGLVMVDEERRYLFANQTYADILGLPDANIVGKQVSEVLRDVYDQIKPRMDAAFAGERVTYELRVPVHAKTGDERFYEVVYEPRVDGEEPYVVVVMVDITERKRVQQRLEELVDERTEKMQETIQELEAFSYSIAHDMRAPLRSMHGFANIVVEDYSANLPEEAQNYLRRIASSAARLDRLIQDVLSYSRIVRANLPLQSVDVEALIREIIQTYPHLHAPGVVIDVEGPMPRVWGNVAGLTQIISNLLGNAVKFVKPGESPRVRVWTETIPCSIANKDETGCVRVWFEDNGIGIAKESQPRVFGMFHRLNPATMYEGTGIGLAIVRKAAERMGGRAGVESEPGEGSRFWVELKLPPAA